MFREFDYMLYIIFKFYFITIICDRRLASVPKTIEVVKISFPQRLF